MRISEKKKKLKKKILNKTTHQSKLVVYLLMCFYLFILSSFDSLSLTVSYFCRPCCFYKYDMLVRALFSNIQTVVSEIFTVFRETFTCLLEMFRKQNASNIIAI